VSALQAARFSIGTNRHHDEHLDPRRPSRHGAHPPLVTREESEIPFAEIFDQIAAYCAGAPINVMNPRVLA